MKRNIAALAAGLTVLAILLTANIASAHAPIRFIHWDSQTNPASLTASTDNRMLETASNSFYLRVYDAQGERVDNGDAVVSADQMSITVTLVSGLDSGAYRVDWKTTSTDGAVLSDSVAISLPGSVEPAPEPEESQEHDKDADEATSDEAPPTSVAPPSTGDGGLLAGGPSGLNTYGALGTAGLLLATAGGLTLAYRKTR
jgi:methionine-rich copper-binding protein CopC